MRAVLALSLVLLALTLALENARWLRPSPPPGPRQADRALELVVGAKGVLLPAARVGTGPETIGEALRIGDRTLVATRPHGLRAAFIGPDLAYRGEAHYDVASSAAERAALAAEVRAAQEGDVLVLASSGNLAPSDGVRDPVFAAALAQLGARARPGAAPRESWALIALRGARAWIPLAEGYSTDSGVALAFVLGADLERYADHRADLVHARSGPQSRLELVPELVHAVERTPGVALAPGAAVQGHASLLMPPRTLPDGRAAAARVAWDGVEIRPSTWLGTLVGIDDRASGSDGAVFQVWFDGERVGERTAEPGTGWRTAFFDLRRFAGRTGTLALVVEPRGDAAGDLALWGWPQLLTGQAMGAR